MMHVCNACGWKGPEDDLEIERAGNCAGEDEYEVCPGCGSGDVVLDWSGGLFNNQSIITKRE